MRTRCKNEITKTIKFVTISKILGKIDTFTCFDRAYDITYNFPCYCNEKDYKF